MVPPAELDRAADELAQAIVAAPRPATEGIKEYLRTAPDMAIQGAVDYARNLHATINSSAETASSFWMALMSQLDASASGTGNIVR